ncbi:MAG: glycosyltransferase family 2 protein [Selenomonadaceae bacterium]|nr:glycosyltransferase family 2 protein [Selenomonadaceae bacterium]
MSGDILFENQIAIVVPVKNESRYIEEWLDYHYRIGVDKFYIYDNNSEDRSDLQKILEPWISEGIVDYQIFDGASAQLQAYCDAIKNHQFDCKYMGFFDLDEFVFVKDRSNLLDFLNSIFNSNSNINALGIDMRIFGSSGKMYRESGGVIERFTRRQSDIAPQGISSKLIANPRYVKLIPSPHFIFNYDGKISVNENLLQLKNQIATTYNSAQKIQLNHYILKSREEFDSKTLRGAGTGEFYDREKRFREFDFNEFEDRSLLDYWNDLKKFSRRDRFNHRSNLALNLIEMLESPFENSVEKYLTCFMLSKKIQTLNESELNLLKNLAPEFLLKSIQSRLRIFDALMLLDFSHEFARFKTETSKKILIDLLNLIPDLIEFYRSLDMWNDYHQLLDKRKTLSTFLSII